MAKVIMVSRVFPNYHPKAIRPTFFMEKIWHSLQSTGVKVPSYDVLTALGQLGQEHKGLLITQGKHHTIRAGKRWKTGDMASLRIWSGKPYQSPQIVIAPDVMITVKDVEISADGTITIDGKVVDAVTVAKNDGLSLEDMCDWFAPSLPFSGQMLIWSPDKLDY